MVMAVMCVLVHALMHQIMMAGAVGFIMLMKMSACIGIIAKIGIFCAQFAAMMMKMGVRA